MEKSRVSARLFFWWRQDRKGGHRGGLSSRGRGDEALVTKVFRAARSSLIYALYRVDWAEDLQDLRKETASRQRQGNFVQYFTRMLLDFPSGLHLKRPHCPIGGASIVLR